LPVIILLTVSSACSAQIITTIAGTGSFRHFLIVFALLFACHTARAQGWDIVGSAGLTPWGHITHQ
jgi:hypothetical protein